MKQFLYAPALLAFATVGAYAQDTGLDDPATSQEQGQLESQDSTGLGGDSQGNTGFGDSQGDTGLGSDSQSGQLGSQGGSQDIVSDFSEADKDSDGMLSIEEAREALPQDVVVIDTNNDGMLNRSEVEDAIPNVSLQGQGGESGEDSAIGEEDYDQIVQSVEQDSGEQEA